LSSFVYLACPLAGCGCAFASVRLFVLPALPWFANLVLSSFAYLVLSSFAYLVCPPLLTQFVLPAYPGCPPLFTSLVPRCLPSRLSLCVYLG
jgi:hypothetical protein